MAVKTYSPVVKLQEVEGEDCCRRRVPAAGATHLAHTDECISWFSMTNQSRGMNGSPTSVDAYVRDSVCCPLTALDSSTGLATASPNAPATSTIQSQNIHRQSSSHTALF